jgi:hypothetical protein
MTVAEPGSPAAKAYLTREGIVKTATNTPAPTTKTAT